MSAWHYLEKLSALPQRGSASPAEATAARLITTELRQLGLSVVHQHFRSPCKTLYYGPPIVMAICIFAALGLGAEHPLLGLALIALSLIPLLGELLGWPLNLDAVLPKHRSQNVVATVAAPEEPPENQVHVYVTAHFDTQFGSWLFAPFFRPYLQPFFTVSYIALALLPITVALHALLPKAVLVNAAMAIAAGYLVLALTWLLINAVTGRYINGANDNGSGVALALHIAEKAARGAFPHTDLCFVFTGSEETGSRGMLHFMESLGIAKRPHTYFLNLDNLGAGIPRYLTGEGMLGYTPYHNGLIQLAERVSAEKGGKVKAQRNLLMPTDGVVASRAGYPAITFIATDEQQRIPNYHWHTDTLERIDQSLLAYMEDYLTALIRAIAEDCRNAALGASGVDPETRREA